jgi:hypothetical protein
VADNLNKTQKQLQELQEQLLLVEDSLNGIASKVTATISNQLGALNVVTKKTAQRYSKDFSQATEKVKKNFQEQAEIRKKILNGETLSVTLVKKLEKLEKDSNKQKEIALRSAENLKRNGLYIDEEILLNLEEQTEEIKNGFDETKNLQKELDKTLGISDLLGEASVTLANKIDESGTLAKVLKGELTQGQKTMLGFQAATAILVAAMFKGSQLIADIRKQTGLSYEAARDLQLEFSSLAFTSGKVFITSEKLNKSFLELTKLTGLIADFGGDTLITQATLTKQLGLSSESAGKISTLARIQSKDTEGILNNTIDSVSALSRQEQVGLNVQGILEEVGSVSAAIAVSLGKNPKSIALAVAQAKLLGLSLSEVDEIASSLLDFETSIANELEAEMLIGKDINLEKARLLALNNDLAGLSEEIRDNEELRLAFSTGNRIQQESAAKAIGVNRDQLAKIVLQQEYSSLLSEQFIASYGEATYKSLQAQDASEKFADTLEKIKGIIVDIGTVFAPVLDAIATMVSSAGAVGAILGGIAAFSFAKMIMSIGLLVIQLKAAAIAAGITSAFLSPAKLAAGLLGAAAVGAVVSGVIASAKADDMVSTGYGDRILSTPKGSIALNNQDTVVAGTNLGGGNNESKRTNQLLERILNKQGTVKIDSTRAGTAFAMGTYQVQ